MLKLICKIGRVEEGESPLSQREHLFSLKNPFFDQVGPLEARVQDSVPVCLQLRDYQVDLGASSGAVGAFDNNEPPSDVYIFEIGYSLAVEF
jgi:hypothetical protein